MAQDQALVINTIAVPIACQDIAKQIIIVRRKLKTLIDYYIYPETVPDLIAAYEPRLTILEARLVALNKLSYSNLPYIIDDSDVFTASFLLDILDQLINAIDGVQKIFYERYDRRLENVKPYQSVRDLLVHREKQIKETRHQQMTDPQRLKAEELRDNRVGRLCNGAVMMINGRDKGNIAFVRERDLLAENHSRLDRYGGAYLWWTCPQCDFRLRYHVAESTHSNINNTLETRIHPGVNFEYKSAFLVKSHLYQPPPAGSYNDSTNRRRRSSNSSGENIISALRPALGRSSTIATMSVGKAKYGCVFCFGLGGEEKRFATGRELASHIADTHRKKMPPPPLLEKFNVAVKGKHAKLVGKWEVNFT
jgi:hypothetical protein